MKVKKMFGKEGKYLLVDGRMIDIKDFKVNEVLPIKPVEKPKKKRKKRKLFKWISKF